MGPYTTSDKRPAPNSGLAMRDYYTCTVSSLNFHGDSTDSTID